MTGLADWVPNAHALVVPLPIGLLVTAAADLVAVLRRRPGRRAAAAPAAISVSGSPKSLSCLASGAIRW